MKKTFLALAVNITLSVPLATSAFAATLPPFTDCFAPNAGLKVKYDTGIHGIVGDARTFSGADAVYTISDKSYTQCFCPEVGNGIQTNWFKVSDLTQNEVQTFVNQGWILVLDGSIWGLEKAPYLAMNKGYTCHSVGGSSTVSNTEVSKSNDFGNGTGGGEILGVATTGSIANITALVTLGIGLVLGGISIKKFRNQ